jgi:hypothetical protein
MSKKLHGDSDQEALNRFTRFGWSEQTAIDLSSLADGEIEIDDENVSAVLLQCEEEDFYISFGTTTGVTINTAKAIKFSKLDVHEISLPWGLVDAKEDNSIFMYAKAASSVGTADLKVVEE